MNSVIYPANRRAADECRRERPPGALAAPPRAIHEMFFSWPAFDVFLTEVPFIILAAEATRIR
jgi:hypothetical protein